MPFTAQKLNGGEHQKSRWVLQMLSGSKSCACNRTSWFVDCVRRVGSALSAKASSILFWMCLNAAYRNTRFFKRMSHHLTCLVLFDNLWKSRLLSGAPEVLLCSIAKTIHTGIETRSHLIFIFYPWKIIHIISAWWWIRPQHTITCIGLFFQYVQWTP